MNFSNLFLKTKIVEVQGVSLTLKKWTYGFVIRNNLIRQQLFGDAENKVPVPTLDQIYDFYAEQVFEGLVSWDIRREEDQTPFELTKENVKLVIAKYADFHLETANAIAQFNSGVDEETKKNLKK